MNKRTIIKTIPDEYAGRKLYSFLRSGMGMSLSLVRTLKVDPEGILLNDRPIRTVDIVKTGDKVTINIREEEDKTTLGETLPDVIYEDEDVLIVSKSPFQAIHETHNHRGDALSNSVALHLHNEGRNCAFRAIGRLDKGTSGIVVCALNGFAAAKLSGKVKKEYLAIPTGRYEGSGTINAPIYRPDPIKTHRTVDEKGDRAVTHWESIKTNGEISLVRVWLETGRTHQIRVHFSHLGTPLYGDSMYGRDGEEKPTEYDTAHQCLHCHKVTFIHPVTDEIMSFEAPMPEDMQRIADRI